MPAKEGALEHLRGPQVSAALSGSSGRRLRIEGVMRPVIGLREAAQRGWALVHSVSEQQADGSLKAMAPEALNAVDLERTDLAAIEAGLAVLAPAEAQERPPLVFLPVALGSVRSLRARRQILRAVAVAEPRLRMVAICELYGMDAGTPSAVLREAAGAVRPIFRGALARVSPDKRSVAQVIDCGFSGAAVEAGDLTEAADAEEALRTVLSLQRVGPGVLLHGVRSVAALNAARLAGASWASLDIVGAAQGAAALAAQLKAGSETEARSPGPPPLILDKI